MTHFHLTLKSTNAKTGPIPVSTTSSTTCPSACPFNHMNEGGCYAASGPLALFWRKVSEGKAGDSFARFLSQIAALPVGQLWRHNQAGDLPGDGDTIDAEALSQLVAANRGKSGFTYTHKPATAENLAAIRAANAGGFTVNLSANSLAHADELAAHDAAPVVVVLPSDVHGNVQLSTPAGRVVAVCPATYQETRNCANCGLCQKQRRKAIVGFPAHGASKRRADAIARGI